MASVPTPISPRAVSPIWKGTEAMAAQRQASVPNLLRPCSYPSRAAGSEGLSAKPSSLMERRGMMNPSLKVSAFQAGAGAGAGMGPSGCEPAGNLYDVLQVRQTASESEIKTAFRRLARQCHPDMVPPQDKEASTTKFLQINSAYSTLADPHTRAQYDLQLSLQSSGYRGRFSRTPRFYTPTGSATPPSNYSSPRTPFSSGRGRSWETDQCWC